jgi:hypothetical protein
MSQDGKSAAEKRSEERQRMYKQVLKERENVDRKERARTAELRALRLAKEAADKKEVPAKTKTKTKTKKK